MLQRATILYPNGGFEVRQKPGRFELEELCEMVGGYIAQVPGLTSFNGQPCSTWCDEEGLQKQLPVNLDATTWWEMTGTRGNDFLVGNVVFIQSIAELRHAD